MSTLFISDLHLDPSRPAITLALVDFLAASARKADALYILGDLFEAWIGDDDDADMAQRVVSALRDLTASGVPVYLMHGNRDFLIGQQFCEASGCQLLADPAVATLYGRRILLMHGDLLCTDDVRYMEFRAEARSPQWQQAVLSRSLAERRVLAAQLRQDSRQATSNKAEDIMDVNYHEVLRRMDEHKVQLLIHGHTHRPDIHHLDSSGQTYTRIVLGDWDQYSWVLEYRPDHEVELIKTLIEP